MLLTNILFYGINCIRNTSGFNTAVRREAYFKCGATRTYCSKMLISVAIDQLGTVKYFPHIKVINSSRRLEDNGTSGTLYYYYAA